MLVPEVRDASSEIILATHLNGIRDPHPHNSPLEPHFSLPTKKDEVLVNKVIDKDTLINRSPPQARLFN